MRRHIRFLHPSSAQQTEDSGKYAAVMKGKKEPALDFQAGL
jgi:hypothetical protein